MLVYVSPFKKQKLYTFQMHCRHISKILNIYLMKTTAGLRVSNYSLLFGENTGKLDNSIHRTTPDTAAVLRMRCLQSRGHPGSPKLRLHRRDSAASTGEAEVAPQPVADANSAEEEAAEGRSGSEDAAGGGRGGCLGLPLCPT